MFCPLTTCKFPLYSTLNLFLQADDDDDDDDFGGPALCGNLSLQSDSDNEKYNDDDDIDDDDDDDGPPTMGDIQLVHRYLSVPNNKPFSI